MLQAWEGEYDASVGQTTHRLTFVVVAHNATREADCRCAAAAPGIADCNDAYFRWANLSVRGRLAPRPVCQVIAGPPRPPSPRSARRVAGTPPPCGP